MKLVRDEQAGSGKERYELHIGRDEIKLLLGLLKSATAHTPRLPETTQMHSRLGQMSKEFMRAIYTHRPTCPTP